jgi:hypothetical protein
MIKDAASGDARQSLPHPVERGAARHPIARRCSRTGRGGGVTTVLSDTGVAARQPGCARMVGSADQERQPWGEAPRCLWPAVRPGPVELAGSALGLPQAQVHCRVLPTARRRSVAPGLRNDGCASV